MTRAIWNDVVLAESSDTVLVEGNHYFPPASLNREYFEASTHRSRCAWKGEAHYFDIVVEGESNPAAAWFYPDPYPEAIHVKDRVAFWKGVNILD